MNAYGFLLSFDFRQSFRLGDFDSNTTLYTVSEKIVFSIFFNV